MTTFMQTEEGLQIHAIRGILVKYSNRLFFLTSWTKIEKHLSCDT